MGKAGKACLGIKCHSEIANCVAGLENRGRNATQRPPQRGLSEAWGSRRGRIALQYRPRMS